MKDYETLTEWYWRGKSWNTRRKPSSSAIFSHIYPTWTGMGSISALYGERLV